ncbi:Hypothetical predicted protein [Lynx pardinus]|uniref:Uncharacterized protein n=1 Tax=Lynx pardinus TaxID=191816 RepID=A0A485NAI4_LYNPA|nr:Hypothetical predicted protein [Lynx pardinus]
MALLAYWGGVLRCMLVRMRGSVEKWRHSATQSVLLDQQSRTGPPSSAPVHSPLFPLSVTSPQVVPLSQVLSQMRLFSLAPYFRRTAALTCSTPLREGLSEQWPNVGCTQECLLHPAVAGALRLQPGASPPPKKIARQCSSSISGTMENRHTHLTPGFTLNNLAPAPANVAAFRGLLGPGGFNSLY